MHGKKPWFRVKRHGYGVGLPIAWEGWLLLALFAGATVLAAASFSKLVSCVVLVFLTPIVILIARFRSDDVWRWRDGD